MNDTNTVDFTILNNKPLIEAIFELRWGLTTNDQGLKTDPNYKLLVGRIYDRLKDTYPIPEQLMQASIPDELAAYVIQHRFRTKEGGWPLVQIGPGIMTLNDTNEYVWGEFYDKAKVVTQTLLDAYAEAGQVLAVDTLILRYIDSVDFDFEKEDVFAFLNKCLKIDVSLGAGLFETTKVSSTPINLDMRLTFPSLAPKGALYVRFLRGVKDGAPALVWETQVQAAGEDAPNTGAEIVTWLGEAHELTHKWFFKMIEGKLLERFK